MSSIPSDRKYSKDHEWVLTLPNGQVRIGITDYAQRQLGDVVNVERRNVGDYCEVTEEFGTVESVKSVSEVYSPVTGTVSAVNDALDSEPEKLNTDPYGDGWIVQFTVAGPVDLDGLLSADEYADYISEETE